MIAYKTDLSKVDTRPITYRDYLAYLRSIKEYGDNPGKEEMAKAYAWADAELGKSK